jgi:hypothetical protein
VAGLERFDEEICAGVAPPRPEAVDDFFFEEGFERDIGMAK